MASNDLRTPAERRAFVTRNHTCVVSYPRKVAAPSMSIVHYAMDGERIVFLTMTERQKARAVRRGLPVSICVLDGGKGALSWPPEYLVVDGRTTIVEDLDYIVARAMQVGEVMLGHPVPADAEPAVRDMMVRENRVAIVMEPESTFHSASVHPDADQGAEEMVHGLGARLAWRE